jgi:hypothetical protein
MHDTYIDGMPVSSEAAFERFGKWVRSELASARNRGMTDEDIKTATGLEPRTWHRWQALQFGPKGPQAESVYKFCDGLGLSRSMASNLLGWSGEMNPVVEPEPEPEVPPVVRELLRRMRDPNLSEEEKFLILETLKGLVARRPVRKE